MELTSYGYALFVSLTLILWYRTNCNRKYLLLAANISFFVLVMGKSSYALVEVLVATYVAWKMTNVINLHSRKRLLVHITVGVIIFILFFVKYISNNIVTALGISYYSLSLIAYILNVYWGVCEVKKNFLDLFLYVSFFPLMISGPVVEYSKIDLNTVRNRHSFDYESFRLGLIRIVGGVLKKTVLASRFHSIDSNILTNWQLYYGAYIWGAILIFTLELYFDFSGCMDIVIGTAQLFGVKLPENFNHPFFSGSVAEIWRRWHITLGEWFKFYFMNPLLKSDTWQNVQNYFLNKSGVDKVKKRRIKKLFTWCGMLLLWILIGIWHGSGLTFLIEGLYFGLIIIFGEIFNGGIVNVKRVLMISKYKNFEKLIQMICTYVLFSIGLLFFKATDLNMAFGCLVHAFSYQHLSMEGLYGNGKVDLVCFSIVFVGWFFAEYISYKKDERWENLIVRQKGFIRWGYYYILILVICFLGDFGSASFIYAAF